MTTLKIVIVGDSQVGKSSILMRFADDLFDSHKPCTVGFDFKLKKVTIDGETVKLSCWDTAGQERFQTLTPAYYRGALGIIVVYDISNQRSFLNVEKWLTEAYRYVTNDKVTVMIIGNKKDKNDEDRMVL